MLPPVVTSTLLADGSSDQVLLPILQWLLDRHCPQPSRMHFASDLVSNSRTLADRIGIALDCFPCDLLFVHRDAERESPHVRQLEIERAWQLQQAAGKLVTVIPVRMTEAWLLLDDAAIRRAAGNPNGQMALELPPPARAELAPDPKELLFDALRRASGLSPSRLRRFRPEAARRRIAELTQSFDGLRALPSFARLEAQVQQAFQP